MAVSGPKERVSLTPVKRLAGRAIGSFNVIQGLINRIKSHISDDFVKSAEIKACESLRNEAYLWALRSDEG